MTVVINKWCVGNSQFYTKLSRKPCKHRAFALPPPPNSYSLLINRIFFVHLLSRKMAIKTKVDALYALERLKRPHFEAGDPWYSCQKTEAYKIYAAKQMNTLSFKCTCGADQDNVLIDELIFWIKKSRQNYYYLPVKKKNK